MGTNINYNQLASTSLKKNKLNAGDKDSILVIIFWEAVYSAYKNDAIQYK